MKQRSAFLVFAALAAFLHASGKTGQVEEPSASQGSLIASVSHQAGNAVLSVASGLPTQPGAVNPLAGKGVVLFKESFGGFLKRKGMFQGPPGSTVKQTPLGVWAYACQTGSPSCQQALYEMRPNSVAEASVVSQKFLYND